MNLLTKGLPGTITRDNYQGTTRDNYQGQLPGTTRDNYQGTITRDNYQGQLPGTTRDNYQGLPGTITRDYQGHQLYKFMIKKSFSTTFFAGGILVKNIPVNRSTNKLIVKVIKAAALLKNAVISSLNTNRVKAYYQLSLNLRGTITRDNYQGLLFKNTTSESLNLS